MSMAKEAYWWLRDNVEYRPRTILGAGTGATLALGIAAGTAMPPTARAVAYITLTAAWAGLGYFMDRESERREIEEARAAILDDVRERGLVKSYTPKLREILNERRN